MNRLISYLGVKPKVLNHVFIASSADVIGNVTIGKESSIWYQCVLRGDINSITIGEFTNIQDHTVIHLSANHGTQIGDHVTIGHGSIIHGCTIEDYVVVGMGSCILDGATISKNSIVGARSLVTKNKTFEEGMLIMGSPAKAVRKLTNEELKSIRHSALNYVQVANEYYEEEKVDS
jgi:carbonic anhydrase/acetyltransferase-like protein (isoleucine patch superfamily)